MKYFIAILLIANFYLSIRNLLWERKVAANYMIGVYLQNKCLEDVVIHNRIPILERVLNLPWAEKINGPLDTSKCDAAEAQWKLYESERQKYIKIVGGA